MKSELTKYVNEALSKRLNETGFEDSYELLGDCLYNTKALCGILDKYNISYTIYGGALIGDFVNKPESFEEAKKIGLVHYWIEVNGYVCEIASESTKYFGESVVIPYRPVNYIVFDDSKIDSLL